MTKDEVMIELCNEMSDFCHRSASILKGVAPEHRASRLANLILVHSQSMRGVCDKLEMILSGENNDD